MKGKIYEQFWFGFTIGGIVGLVLTQHILGVVFTGLFGLLVQGGIISNSIRFKGGRMVHRDEEDEGKAFLGREQYFMENIMALAAAVIKADGKTGEKELSFVQRKLMRDYSHRSVNRMMQLLAVELQRNQVLMVHTGVITDQFSHASKIQLMHFLVSIAITDGVLTTEEYQCLRNIAVQVEISVRTFESILAMFKFRHEHTKQNERPERKTSTHLLDSAYRVLEIDKTATDKEVKKAYRKLAVLHHPDKVSHLGAEFQKAANEKFQTLVAAYELIQKHRKFV